MKRDLDLLRDILLAVEAAEGPFAFVDLSKLSPVVNCDDMVKLSFHVALLIDESFIDCHQYQTIYGGYIDYQINRLTMPGIRFLDTIRKDNVWVRVKPLLQGFHTACTLALQVKQALVDLGIV